MPLEPSLRGTLPKAFSNPAPFQLLTAAEILNWGKRELEFLGDRQAAFEAESLLEEILGCSRSTLYLEASREVPAEGLNQFREWIRSRKARVPLAYLLRRAFFWNESLEVGPGCLIPRPETEILVERFIKTGGFPQEQSFQFVDLGCGSGAIGIALLRHFENARASFFDISKEALEITRKNLHRYDLLGRSEVLHSDLFEAARNVAKENSPKWDAILFNPPYLSKEDWKSAEPEILFEPRLALDGGEDGFIFYDRILAEGREFLNPGGWLALEAGQGQAARVAEGMRKNSFKEVQIFQDYNSIERVILGRAN